MERVWRVEPDKGDFQEPGDLSNGIHNLLCARDHGLLRVIFYSDNGVLITNEIEQFSGTYRISTQSGHIPIARIDSLQCLHALGHNKSPFLHSKSARTDQCRNFTEAMTDKDIWL